MSVQMRVFSYFWFKKSSERFLKVTWWSGGFFMVSAAFACHRCLADWCSPMPSLALDEESISKHLCWIWLTSYVTDLALQPYATFIKISRQQSLSAVTSIFYHKWKHTSILSSQDRVSAIDHSWYLTLLLVRTITNHLPNCWKCLRTLCLQYSYRFLVWCGFFGFFFFASLLTLLICI